MSTDLELAIQSDDELYDLDAKEPVEPKTTSSRLSNIVDKAMGVETPAEKTETPTDSEDIPL
jgi:hypothetical protein